jgi:hypothetical protein
MSSGRRSMKTKECEMGSESKIEKSDILQIINIHEKRKQ